MATYDATPIQAFDNLIFVSEEGLILRNAEGREIWPWEKIKHLFHTARYNTLEVVDEEGKASSGYVLKDDQFESVPEKIKCIWDMWRDKTPDAGDIHRFDFYPWMKKRSKRSAITWSLVQGVFWSGMAVFLLFYGDYASKPKTGPCTVFGFCAGSIFLISAVYYMICWPKRTVRTICLAGRKLTLEYDDGTSRILTIRNLRRCNWENPRRLGAVVFGDGTKLKDIDRYSYWPLLREGIMRVAETGGR